MDDINRELREKLRRIRPHANFFEWPDKVTKELDVVRTLLGAAEADEVLAAVCEVRPGPNPPDAIGTREDGALIAIEATELVDQEVLEHNVRV